MTVLAGLSLVLERLWLWARAAGGENTAALSVREVEIDAKREIAARRRRAEEQLHRLAQRERS